MTATRGIQGKLIFPALLLGAAVLTGAAALPDEPPSVKKDTRVAIDRYGDPLPSGAVARLGTLRFRHQWGAYSLAFSPDGKALACNNQVVWDAATGKELYRLPEMCLAISPDWTTSAHVDLLSKVPPKIVLRELRTGKKIRELDWPKSLNRWMTPTLRFAPNGKSFVLISDRMFCSEAHVINAESGKAEAVCKTNGSSIYCCAFSPDSKTLALGTDPTGADNPSLQLWDIAAGKMIHGIENPKKDHVTSIAFSADGKTVASGSWDYIILSDVASGQEVRRLEADHLQVVGDLLFTPDGKTLISSSQDGKLRIWDVAIGKARFTLDGGKFGPTSMALSADGKTLAVGGTVAVRLWNVETGNELFTEFVGHDSAVCCLDFSPEGKTLASGGNWTEIRVWDTAGWNHNRLLKGGGAFSFSPDGKRLASCPYDKTVNVWEVATGKSAMTITVADTDLVASARFSADGLKLFTLDRTFDQKDRNADRYRVRHWDAATGKQEDLWTLRQRLRPLLLAADGHTVVAQDEAFGGFHDVKSGRDRLLHGHEEGLADRWNQQLVFSPDGRVLATGKCRGDYAVWLWEVATGKEIYLMKGHECSIGAIAWSPDGRVLASGDWRYRFNEKKALQTVRLWDVVTGKELARFTGFNSDVTSLVFSPDGAYVAAGLSDSTILVWDVGKIGPKLVAQKLSKDELETRWADLIIGDDAEKAHRASWALIAAPQQSIPLLRDRLKPVAVTDAAKIQKWIAELDSDEFAVRDAATKALTRLGAQAEAPIAKALKGDLAPEARRRLEGIAATLGDGLEAETVRTIRAVMVLEKIGSPAAREVLERLAHGAAGVRETEDAKAALARLAK